MRWNDTGEVDTLGGGGSIFAMTSIGTLSNNFASEPNFQLSSDIKINQAYQNNDSGYKSFVMGFMTTFATWVDTRANQKQPQKILAPQKAKISADS